MDLYIQFSQSSNPKSKSSSNISKLFKYKPTLDKSSMKSKIEFKYDIEKQDEYPSYLQIWKLSLNKSTLQREYSKSNQIYFTKINSSTNPLEEIIKLFHSKLIFKSNL